MTLFLSRLTLNRSAGNAALAPLLDPADPSQGMSAHHRLLWSVFADGPDRTRDFLWRAEGGGRFFVLSHRAPAPNDLFLPPEVKEFAPALAVGDRLAFVLRANATRDLAAGRRDKTAGKPRRVDLVVDLLRGVPKGERANERMTIAGQAATDWMARQGAAHGFQADNMQVNDYHVAKVPQSQNAKAPPRTFGVLDMSGSLTVTDPAAFTTRLAQGFGRARAFGCGLMLIRRV